MKALRAWIFFVLACLMAWALNKIGHNVPGGEYIVIAIVTLMLTLAIKFELK